MKIRTVYLAGGINGLSDADANDWRTEIKTLLPREIGVIDPMSRDYRGKEDENVEAIVKGDLSDIQASDAVVAYCPRPSWGTAMEIHHVATEGRYIRVAQPPTEMSDGKSLVVGTRRTVAIVPHGQPVSPWLRHHTDEIVGDLALAAQVVKEWAGLVAASKLVQPGIAYRATGPFDLHMYGRIERG